MEKRKATRKKINKKVKSHNWEKGVDECMVDISEKGCKLNTNLIYHIGDKILMNIEGKSMIGTVVRKNHKGFGIKF